VSETHLIKKEQTVLRCKTSKTQSIDLQVCMTPITTNHEWVHQGDEQLSNVHLRPALPSTFPEIPKHLLGVYVAL